MDWFLALPLTPKLKPWYGALAMSLSSFTVVMNALRLNLFNKLLINYQSDLVERRKKHANY